MAMTLSVAVSAIVIIVGLMMIVALVAARRRSHSDVPPVVDDNDGAEWREGDSVAQLVERDPDLRWPKMLARNADALDDDTRLRLIRDLALVRAPWCVAILQQAYEEERLPALRRAVGEALDACGVPIEAYPSTSSGT
jgi:hypothetical protein